MTDEIKTIVLDAGGRYGLHPSWKPFTGELLYYLFEPDIEEANRLRSKYDHKKDKIIIDDRAINDTNGTINLNILSNRAMSTSFIRSSKKEYFKGEISTQVDIIEERKVKAVSVDSFCKDNNINLDFIKLDVEGGEYKILKGGGSQYKNLLGIRCEVNFDETFEGTPVFSKIHDFLLDKDFFLLNLDYDGKGAYCNEFVKVNGKYGIIKDCDAVWLKKYDALFESKIENLEIRVLKYAAFCLMNNASDVAIDVLSKAVQTYSLNFNNLKNTRLYKFVDIAIHKLFYSLKWQPGQSLEKHKEVYFEIFNKKMKETHEYNQSIELNPD
jgi:FkbM family methyltransferase